MRSLVAEIFHSLSRNSSLVSSPNSSSCGPMHHADRRVGRRRQFDPLLAGAAGRRHLQFVAGLQRARIGTAETGAGIDGEAAEHRLAAQCRLRWRDS